MYGVPDELKIAEDERDRIREAAVEFGRFRRQFTGSTQFWMDQHRTELAKSRYAMDEPLWRGVHPPEYFGDGGYLYNTAESVGGAVIWGPSQRILIENPRPVPVASSVPTDRATTPTAKARARATGNLLATSKANYDAAASVGANSNW
jgi:hypothetical protein